MAKIVFETRKVAVADSPRLPAWLPDAVVDDPYSGLNPPLIDFDRKLVLSWSAKSACTHVLIWFLVKNGLMHAANYYNPWPHEFRQDVLSKAKAYLSARNDAISNPQKYTVVRFMRDPIARLSSALRHMLRARYNEDELSIALQRGFSVETGLTIREFISYMQMVDLKNTNPHHASQINKVDHMNGYGRKIFVKLDEPDRGIGEKINVVEAELGQIITDFSKVPKIDWVRQTHYQDASGQGTQEVTLDTVLTSADGLHWPSTRLTDFLRSRREIHDLLAEDIRLYENPADVGFTTIV
jgi:hypothetical protein